MPVRPAGAPSLTDALGAICRNSLRSQLDHPRLMHGGLSFSAHIAERLALRIRDPTGDVLKPAMARNQSSTLLLNVPSTLIPTCRKALRSAPTQDLRQRALQCVMWEAVHGLRSPADETVWPHQHRASLSESISIKKAIFRIV